MLCVSEAHGAMIEVSRKHQTDSTTSLARHGLYEELHTSAESPDCIDFELQSVALAQQKREARPTLQMVPSGACPTIASARPLVRSIQPHPVALALARTHACLRERRTIVLLI